MASDHGNPETDVDPVTGFALRTARSLRDLPADLGASVVLVSLTNLAVFTPIIRETPLRVLFGLPFVLFVPGYVVVAALFPESGGASTQSTADDGQTADEGTATDQGIDGIERVALSFGLSIAVVPLLGLVLNFTPWGIRLVPILICVSGFVFGAVAVAAVRRQELPADERYTVPYQQWVSAVQNELFAPDDRADAALNILLVISILLATSSVAYAVAVPKQGESFSEFYLLTEDDGELVADGYPTEFTQGEPQELVVGVSNQEYQQTNYTVLVETHRVQITDNETSVIESESLQRFEMSLAHNETWQQTHSVAPTLQGERLRLTYLLYRGEPAPRTTPETAYRETHLWINVSS